MDSCGAGAHVGLMGNTSAPVVIVGAGMAGLTAANLLAADGLDVLLIEQADAIEFFAQ